MVDDPEVKEYKECEADNIFGWCKLPPALPLLLEAMEYCETEVGKGPSRD